MQPCPRIWRLGRPVTARQCGSTSTMGATVCPGPRPPRPAFSYGESVRGCHGLSRRIAVTVHVYSPACCSLTPRTLEELSLTKLHLLSSTCVSFESLLQYSVCVACLKTLYSASANSFLFRCLPQCLPRVRCGAGVLAARHLLHESLPLPFFFPFVSIQCSQTIHIHRKNVLCRISPDSTSSAFAFFISRIKIPTTCAPHVGLLHSVEARFSVLIFY